MTDWLKAGLAKRISDRKVLVVVGTGVSLASAGGNELASWKGLIANGLERCAKLSLREATWVASQKKLLEGDLDDLLGVAEQVSRRLGWKKTEPCDGLWSGWLRDTVGELRANHPELIKAIHNLGAPIATLNYDNLLTNVTGLRPITWQQAERWLPVLQGGDHAILHLHGHWDHPSSVVLGIRSYDAVLGQGLAQHLQRALTSWLSLAFIGCSATLEDPNFSALLTWMREQLSGAEHSHYLLIRENEPPPVDPPLLRQARVVPLPYGREPADLLPFIRDLAPKQPTVLHGFDASGEARAHDVSTSPSKKGDLAPLQKRSPDVATAARSAELDPPPPVPRSVGKQILTFLDINRPKLMAALLWACISWLLLLVVLTYQHPLSTFMHEDPWSRLAMILGFDDPPPAVEAAPGITYLGSQTDDKIGAQLDSEIKLRFEIDTKIPVNVKPFTGHERLNTLRDQLKNGGHLYDVVTIDIAWIGELSDYLIDLTAYFPKDDLSRYDEKIIEHNKVGSKLVAIPWFKDIGVLYYRKDLLEKHGEKVPYTWLDLKQVAWVIQEEEKKDHPDFIGFAWQGASYEGLTCNALEWIASWGGIDGNGLLDKEAVRKALEFAKDLVQGPQSISEGVENDKESGSLAKFLSGNAAFLRSWQNDYIELLGDDHWSYEGNGCKKERCFGVRPLPRGNDDKNATVLGGWQLAIPMDSSHKLEALEFVRYATHKETEVWRTHKGGYLPPTRSIEGLPFLQREFNNVKEVIRPFNKAEYQRHSTCFSSAVNSVLVDKSDKQDKAVESAIEKMQGCGIIAK